MIDEKKLIEDIEKEIEFAMKCNMPAMVAGMRQIASIIENQPKIGEWIPCSERLPDYGERVLLQDFGGNITLEKCERKKGVKGFTDGNLWASANNYIAWQPLPQPYHQKGE